MKLYWSKQLPLHWIIEGTDSNLYICPNIANGWQSRTPYKGYLAALKEVGAEETLVMLQFCGCEKD